MTPEKLSPEDVLANLREVIKQNYEKHFGPYSLPREEFVGGDANAIEPFDLQRAANPEFQQRMQNALRAEGEHVGRVARRLNIDGRIVRDELHKMRFADPEIKAQVREALDNLGSRSRYRSYEEVASGFNVALNDVEQLAHDMLAEDPDFLALFEDAV